jgi:hypothetical protein
MLPCMLFTIEGTRVQVYLHGYFHDYLIIFKFTSWVFGALVAVVIGTRNLLGILG